MTYKSKEYLLNLFNMEDKDIEYLQVEIFILFTGICNSYRNLSKISIEAASRALIRDIKGMYHQDTSLLDMIVNRGYRKSTMNNLSSEEYNNYLDRLTQRNINDENHLDTLSNLRVFIEYNKIGFYLLARYLTTYIKNTKPKI